MMIHFFEIGGQEDILPVVSNLRKRSEIPEEALALAGRVIEAVRRRGDEALVELTMEHDGVYLNPPAIEVGPSEREKAWNELPADLLEALMKAASRIAEFSRHDLSDEWAEEVDPGVTVGQLYRPVRRVGLYVPGGRCAYPSTVLMTGIPAREAGVRDIIVCTPPGERGRPPAATLAATHLLGNCRVFAVGGAQAVAAMALGTETVPACDFVAGPGNVYVAAAKRLLAHTVSTDLEAGPSEVAVYAGNGTDPGVAAADMLAQLEHDPMALAVCVADSDELAQSVRRELEYRGSYTGGTAALIRCPDRQLALEFLNRLAPEHLEILVEDAEALLGEISEAGCVFAGPFSGVALGDYIAGPSHVLPTGGAARRLSGLRASDFRRTVNLVRYTREGFLNDVKSAVTLSRAEGMEMHARSLEERRDNTPRTGGPDG